MEDLKPFAPAIAGVAVIVLIAGSIGWLLDHPATLVVLAATVAVAVYLFARWRAARNRV